MKGVCLADVLSPSLNDAKCCVQAAPPGASAGTGAPTGILSGADAEAAEERYGTTAVEGPGAGGGEQARRQDTAVAPSSISAMLREVELGLNDWRQTCKPGSGVSRGERARLPGHPTSNESRCCHVPVVVCGVDRFVVDMCECIVSCYLKVWRCERAGADICNYHIMPVWVTCSCICRKKEKKDKKKKHEHSREKHKRHHDDERSPRVRRDSPEPGERPRGHSRREDDTRGARHAGSIHDRDDDWDTARRERDRAYREQDGRGREGAREAKQRDWGDRDTTHRERDCRGRDGDRDGRGRYGDRDTERRNRDGRQVY